MAQYPLKYKTYDQLLAEVQSDFKKYYLEDYIDPQDFIKVAKKCNYDLGLKIFKTKNAIVEIDRGIGKLPNDFNIINYAFVLSNFKIIEPMISGTHVERVPVSPTYDPGVDTIDLCQNPILPDTPTCSPIPTAPGSCTGCGQRFNICACLPIGEVEVNCKGEASILIQRFKFYTREWSEFHRIKIIPNPDYVDPNCPNIRWQAKNSAYIQDGYIKPSFKTGSMYINYQAMMEDNDGNLIVPDHERLNEFYEYALKQRILENMIMNGVTVTQTQVQLIETRYREAKNNALSFVNTPDFYDLQKIWEVNRKAQYSNYYDMFRG